MVDTCEESLAENNEKHKLNFLNKKKHGRLPIAAFSYDVRSLPKCDSARWR